MILKGLSNRIESNQRAKNKKDDIKDPSFRVNYVCNVDVITWENKILFIYLLFIKSQNSGSKVN